MEHEKKIVGAVAQLAQEFFDTPANLKKACEAIREAGHQGADIIVFSECFLGQYPYWAQYHNTSAAGFIKTQTALFENAIQINGEACKKISEAAKESGIYVVMGCNELSDKPGSETIYNSLLFFNRNGKLIGRHRKLMPTHHERLVHGRGDGRDLRVYNTDIGMLGGLICYEHHMTLSKYAMASMGEEIHVANWPGMFRVGNPANDERTVEPDNGPCFVGEPDYAIREYAAETGNFVLSASGYLPNEKIPDEWKKAIPSLQADWANGGSAIVAPGGQYLVEPVVNEERILYAELDFNTRRTWKAFFDPVGHYSRPDVYSLQLTASRGREFSYDNLKDGEYFSIPEKLLNQMAKKYEISYEMAEQLYKEVKEKL